MIFESDVCGSIVIYIDVYTYVGQFNFVCFGIDEDEAKTKKTE